MFEPDQTAPRFDPRVLFAAAGYFSMFAVIFRNLYFMAALFVLAFLYALVLRVSPGALWRKCRRLWQIALIATFLQSVFSPSGQVLLNIKDFPLLTVGGLEKGALVLLRLSVLIISGVLFTTYPTRTLIQGLIQIRLPYEIAYMVLVGLRFVPMLGEELRDAMTAMQLRGIVVEKLRFGKRIQLYTYLLLPAVAGTIFRARELSMSMDMRGFRALPYRTSYQTLTLRRRDRVALVLIAALAAATAFLYFYFGI